MRKVNIKISKTDPWVSKTEEYMQKLTQEFIEKGIVEEFTKKNVDAFYYSKEVLAPEDTGNLRNTMKNEITREADKLVFTFSVSAYDFNEEVEYGKLHELVTDGIYTYHKEGTMNHYMLRAINRKFGTNFEHSWIPF